jgi:hypothetical protein
VAVDDQHVVVAQEPIPWAAELVPTHVVALLARLLRHVLVWAFAEHLGLNDGVLFLDDWHDVHTFDNLAKNGVSPVEGWHGS